MTLDLYKSVVAKLLPTPTRFHYIFNLRDLSRLFGGLSKAVASGEDDTLPFFRLWRNESIRVFHDRLISDEDRTFVLDKVSSLIASHASTHAPTLAPPPPPVAAAAPAAPAAPPPAAAPRAFAADPDVENAVIEELVVPPDDPAALRAPFPRAPAAAAPAAPAAAARDPDHALGAAPRGVDRAMLPEVVASTLDHVVGQLDIITSTLAILEQRLSITEDRVSTILKSKTEEPSS